MGTRAVDEVAFDPTNIEASFHVLYMKQLLSLTTKSELISRSEIH